MKDKFEYYPVATKKSPIKEEQPEGENDWFFDIIINFLRSPRWKTPIMSFLDEYCIIFDNEDENKLEYTSIHHQFKKIVEELIGELLAELGVDQVVARLGKPKISESEPECDFAKKWRNLKSD